jgi:hypothetical protein
MNDPKKNANPDLQGEGNYDASRHYREGLEKSVREGRAEELGEEAKEALEGPEGDALKKADEQGKRAQTPERTSRR